MTATSWPPPAFRCPECSQPVDPNVGLDSHTAGCPFRKRVEEYTRTHPPVTRATGVTAVRPDVGTATRAAPAEGDSRTMSTKTLTKAAQMPADDLNVEELTELARKLQIEGRSKLTKRDDLLKAIRKQQKAILGDSPTPAAAEPERETLEQYGDIKVGDRVRVVRNVDLSARTSGYNGVVPKDATGKVTELRPAGGGGVQVVADVKDVGEVAIGARHFEPVG